jgi:hypothetical protein
MGPRGRNLMEAENVTARQISLKSEPQDAISSYWENLEIIKTLFIHWFLVKQ